MRNIFKSTINIHSKEKKKLTVIVYTLELISKNSFIKEKKITFQEGSEMQSHLERFFV